MDDKGDKQWATKYLLDPLNAPEPSQETGPGTHFASTLKTNKTPPPAQMPTPPGSASPSRSTFHPSNPYSPSHRQQAFAAYSDERPTRLSPTGGSPNIEGSTKGRRRGSSLGERFPGDMSHRPLQQLKKEAKSADRSPHLKKKHIPGADVVDSLDMSVPGGPYHHGGPYDATLLSRNLNPKISPVAAVQESNMEALKATPKEYVRDALDKHVPLQGTAIIPPGEQDFTGEEMRYQEGDDLMREADAPGGAYKRWPGMKYHPDDLKGKGEPSFTIERALKEQALRDRRAQRSSFGESGYEMQAPSERMRSVSGHRADTFPEHEGGLGRSNTTGRKIGEGIKRRFGSLRKSRRTSELE